MKNILRLESCFLIVTAFFLHAPTVFAEDNSDEPAGEEVVAEEAVTEEPSQPPLDFSSALFLNETLMNLRHPAAFLSRHQIRSATVGMVMGSSETKMSASSKDVTIEKSPFILDAKVAWPINPRVWAGFWFLSDSTAISYSNDLADGKRDWVELNFAGAYGLDEKTTLGFELIQVTASVKENGFDSVSASYITFVPSVRYLMGEYEILASYRPSKKSESGEGSVRDFGYLKFEGNFFMSQDKRLGTVLSRVFNKAVDSDGLEDSWDLTLSGRYLVEPELWTGAALIMRQAKYKDDSFLTEETMGSWSLRFDGEWLWKEKQTIGGLFKYTSGSDERVVYGEGGKLDVKFEKSAWDLGVNYQHQF